MAKKAKKKTTKKKVSKKKVTKKVVKKAAKKKAVKKVTKKRTLVNSSMPVPSLIDSIWCDVKDLHERVRTIQKEIAAIKILVQASNNNSSKTLTQKVDEVLDNVVENTSVPYDDDNLFGNMAPPQETAAHTKEDITQALQEVMTVVGKDQAINILTKFKAARISEIKETDYPLFYSTCTAATENTNHTNI